MLAYQPNLLTETIFNGIYHSLFPVYDSTYNLLAHAFLR